MGTKSAPIAIRFDTNRPTDQQVKTKIKVQHELQEVQYQLRSLPLYLVERLDTLIAR